MKQITVREFNRVKKYIQKMLTGCYAGEKRLGLLKGDITCEVGIQLAKERGAQIQIVETEEKYIWFAPKQDTMPYKGFKWK